MIALAKKALSEPKRHGAWISQFAEGGRMKVVGSESKILSFTEEKYLWCELHSSGFKNNLSFLILLIMYLIGKFKNFDEV